MTMKIFHKDLTSDISISNSIAIDCEATGLNFQRDRLCLVQISDEQGNTSVVHIKPNQTEAPVLCSILTDPKITKIFHYARFDMAILYNTFNVMANSIYCTKIASLIARTYTPKHGLKCLVKEILNINIDKKMQSSYWGANNLSKEQLSYASNDVIYLHKIMEYLNIILEKEKRKEIANSCFEFLPARVKLDLMGWQNCDIFAHDATP